MSSPWANIQEPDTVNLDDIMFEERAKSRQEKGTNKILQNEPTSTNNSSSSRYTTIKPLDMQLDKELEEHIEETDYYDPKDESVEDRMVTLIESKHWDAFESSHHDFGAKPAGSSKKIDETALKRENKMRGLKNVSTLLTKSPLFRNSELKPEFCTWIDNRYHEDGHTGGYFVDENAQISLSEMINDKIMDRVNGIISVGTEALILHADAESYPSENGERPKELAIKVFQLSPLDLEERKKLLNRFKESRCHDFNHIPIPIKRIVKNDKKVGSKFAKKEMINLERLSKAGVACPEVVAFKYRVVVMSFIGENGVPAPMLKDLHKNKEIPDYTKVYHQVIDAMRNMYQKANLIHTDLSGYNILWHNERCYIIDTSRAVESNHKDAFEFLFRDCTNITKFFVEKRVPNLLTPVELMKSITGFDFNNKPALSELQASLKMSKLALNVKSADSALK